MRILGRRVAGFLLVTALPAAAEFERHLGPSSNCSSAFGGWQRGSAVPSTAPQFALAPLQQPATVKLVNVGHGTTGTRGIHAHLMRQAPQLKSIHHGLNNAPSPSREAHLELYELNRCLKACTGTCRGHATCNASFAACRPRSNNCRAERFIRETRRLLPQLLTGGAQVLADDPYNYLADDIIQLAPSAYYLMSVRDANGWAKRRPFHDAVICTEAAGQRARHDFDWVGCLQGATFADEGFMHLNKLPTAKVEQAYVRFTAHVASLAPPGHFRAVCPWDDGMAGVDQVAAAVFH